MLRAFMCAGLLAVAWHGHASAQVGMAEYNANGGRVPGTVNLCPDPAGSGNAVVCPTASGGGGGGAITASPGAYSAPVTVPMAAGAVVQLIGPNANRRALIVLPSAPGCAIDPSGGTAATMLIPNGWAFDQLDPPPKSAVTGSCAQTATIVVVEAN